ncbi:hypothetical protein [Citrobacter freundii]|uniref:hypothetical protein n=1 Tax=Citrobacter freundii TaxID=546 RepID=UPI001EF03CA5|nr:hypothetical protein [Citrobacter freundii]
MTITVGCPQTNRKTDTGKTLKPWPVLVDHYSLNIAAARIVNLESEIEELKEENRRYKQQFVIWQYNAYKHGMTEHQLNAQLTKIDRERSDGEKR